MREVAKSVGFAQKWGSDAMRTFLAAAMALVMTVWAGTAQAAEIGGFAAVCRASPSMKAAVVERLAPHATVDVLGSRKDALPPDDGGFTADQVRPLLRTLLDRVHDVTGHPRQKGWGATRECAAPS